jgi:16S rRNA (guanine527-N7)-methyltransferase
VAALSTEEIATLLHPFIPRQAPSGELAQSPHLLEQLSAYLDVLLRWNHRVNLTAIREPEEIVWRHFGESLFAAVQLAPHLPPGSKLLDFGSGAGFPGLPIQLLLPHVKVTLAESQTRKASFLREAVRTLKIPVMVWSSRVEQMPPGRNFDMVTLRAVDRIKIAKKEAAARVRVDGWLAMLAGRHMEVPPGAQVIRMPRSQSRRVILWQKPDVPRGTSPEEEAGSSVTQ